MRGPCTEPQTLLPLSIAMWDRPNLTSAMRRQRLLPVQLLNVCKRGRNDSSVSDISPHQMGITLNILLGTKRFIHSGALLILFCLHFHFLLQFSRLLLPLRWPPVTLLSRFSSSASISYSKRREGGLELELWGVCPEHLKRHLLPPLSPPSSLSVSEGA